MPKNQLYVSLMCTCIVQNVNSSAFNFLPVMLIKSRTGISPDLCQCEAELSCRTSTPVVHYVTVIKIIRTPCVIIIFLLPLI